MAQTNKPISKDYLIQSLKGFEAEILRTDFVEKYASYSEMPTAASTIEGKIIQYVGANDVTHGLVNGFFYECIEGTTSGTYEWVEKQVQTIPAAVEYSIVKEATPDTGYFATYQLYGQVGSGSAAPISGSAKINIPKDFLVKSAEVKTVTAADKEAGGIFYNNPDFAVGDKYIDFVVNVKEGSATDEHIYLNVKDLTDVYTGGDGITVGNDNSIAIDLATASGLELTGTSPNKQLAVKPDNTTPDQMRLYVGASGLYGSILLADPNDPDEAIDFDTEW